MKDFLTIPIIGKMCSPFHEKFGIPRQPNLVDVESSIEMNTPFDDLRAFDGIEQFSHLWLLWHFHENKAQSAFRPQVRPPRLGGNEKIGVFATRSMYRPAPIGLSVVKFKRIEKTATGVSVVVSGSDLLNGTPILDIKPYIGYSDAITDAVCGYAMDTPTVKKVVWDIESSPLLSQQHIADIEQILGLDPRPAYQNDETRIYGMRFAHVNVRFFVDTLIHVVAIEAC